MSSLKFAILQIVFENYLNEILSPSENEEREEEKTELLDEFAGLAVLHSVEHLGENHVRWTRRISDHLKMRR